ncbi:CotY/CotZ family spore coat protein [Aciduricibacillus chroicocephali]|uniref:CotY/CotZ family spore coat protein n=1 Tax=Aciduricibacillus chroicocephali TaxID=3054939 RepID=A0ABY9KXH7_9BACI|nr:CotY/CotZ family spore coat protein [Bacillaceae bacterium 44XB]
MGCGENVKPEHLGENCVSRILREIVAAQNDVVNNDCCDTSCEQSISDLLGETEPGNDLDTVPVILYCKGTCKPFKGYGVGQHHHHGHDKLTRAIGSFFFKVKKVTNDNCAVLELLASHGCHKPDTEVGHENEEGKCKDDPKTPACQPTDHLQATGLCLTVDLNCFCHVTCLPAIQANC